jgi:hypothetical protein
MYQENHSHNDVCTDNVCKSFRSRHTSNNEHIQQNIGVIHNRVFPLQ